MPQFSGVRPSQRCPTGPPQSRGACKAGCAELVVVLAFGNDAWLFLDSRLVSWGHDIRRGLQQEPAGSAGKHLRVTLSSIFAIRDIRDVEVSCWRGALADFVGQRRAARANFVHLFVPRARSRIYFTTGNAPCPLGSQQSSQLAGLRVLCFRFELARVLDSSSH